jgi:hypothetical protein
MVVGKLEAIEKYPFAVAAACNHPDCLVLRFSFPMV